eukprot:s636_g6.t1
MPCNCGAAAGCDGGTPCSSMDSTNFRGSGCGGCCQAAMCGGTPCGCSNLPSGGCCSPAGSQGAQPGETSGTCGGCNFNSQQLPLVGLLPIQQGMPLGMPMALISTGGGQGGCFPAAYLMAQALDTLVLAVLEQTRFNAAATAYAESNESTDDANVSDESPVRLERRCYRWSIGPVGFMTIHVFHPLACSHHATR